MNQSYLQPPEPAVIVMKPHKPTPCSLPHFTRDGRPRDVPGLVYRTATGTELLCAMHGKARHGL